MNAQQRHSFMEQRKAALAELEQIRNNLASVRSELRHEEAKSKLVLFNVLKAAVFSVLK